MDILTLSIGSCLGTRCWVANWCTRWSDTGHASSELGRFGVNVKIVVRSPKFLDGRVAAAIPVDRDVVDSGNLLNLGWDSLVGPTESKVRKSIICELWWYNGWITLNHGVRSKWKSLVVLENNLHIISTSIIDFLKRAKIMRV